jgi:hypothetical protein
MQGQSVPRGDPMKTVSIWASARLFPLHLAMLALAAWSAGTVLRQADVPALGALFSPRTPVRGIAVYMWAVTGLNAAAWLSRIIPALSTAGVPAYLRGTGLATDVVNIQDLALRLPLLAVAAGWLWGCRSHGYLLAGAGLVLWILESLSIAVDQWYGHAADPVSPVASGRAGPRIRRTSPDRPDPGGPAAARADGRSPRPHSRPPVAGGTKPQLGGLGAGHGRGPYRGRCRLRRD